MKILKESKDLFDYKLGILTARFKKDHPRGKARIVEGMLPTLSKIKNAVLKSSYLKRMSEELAVDEESIRTELKKTKPAATVFRTTVAIDEDKRRTVPSLAETTLLAIVLEDADLVKKVEKELGFEKFKDESVTNILSRIGELHKNGKRITASHLISYFENSRIEEIISEAVSIGQTMQDKNRVLNDCFRHIRKDSLKEALSRIQFMIKEAEIASDRNRVNKLIAEYNELIKKAV